MELVVYVIQTIIRVYIWLIIARIVFSWIGVPRQDLLRQFYEFTHQVTEPYLSLFRNIIPIFGGFDFSPLVAIIVLELVQQVVINLVRSL